MPEIKRNFNKSKMNKDLDERLVPAGEYRDANNIEINTSDGDDVGTVQNVLGNTALTNIFHSKAVCVGGIANNKTDKIYWMVDAGIDQNIKKDYIVEWDIVSKTFKYVVVDIYEVNTTASAAATASTEVFVPKVSSISTYNNTGIRKDMTFIGGTADEGDDILVVKIEFDSSSDSWKVTLSESVTIDSSDTIKLKAQRVLNFFGGDSNNPIRYITGINIIDDLLFWTDNVTEPKKINITRCIQGTGGFVELNTPDPSIVFTGDTDHIHTRLVSQTDGYNNEVITNFAGTRAEFLQERHLTVLRKGPLVMPYLEMSDTESSRGSITTTVNIAFSDPITLEIFESGPIIRDITFATAVDYRVGDVIILTNDVNAPANAFTDHEVRIRIESKPTTASPNTGPYGYSILGINANDVSDQPEDFLARLEQKKPMFEMDFVRFGYRYKYADGEYSVFSPFTEPAFIPGPFEYASDQGYNLGMTNRLRELKITDFVPETSQRGADIIEIDILFKKENSNAIYTVTTIKQTDTHWPTTIKGRGEYILETELIHALVESNQILRPWDNVPLKAKAQEITGNKLVYGNYVQGYDMVSFDDKTGINTELVPKIETSLQSEDTATTDFPKKSTKTLRKYQIGVVYRDEYGRETPVFPGDPDDSVVKIEKEQSTKSNRIKARLTTPPPSWAKSWKFFVKETANEYYNLAMDRWYNAEDGNVWLSFPSAERNKIQEDTFLILKKQHNNDKAVTEKARYKVIAIENEAPDYIKKEVSTLGSMDNTNNNTISATSTDFPFVDTNFFRIDSPSEFYKAFFPDNLGTQDPLDENFKTNLRNGYVYIRFVGPNKRSKYYRLTNITTNTTTSGGLTTFTLTSLKLRIDKKFGDDVRFLAPTQATGSIISGISLEMVVKKPKNKPEFDGRFFVKVYKDLVLEENILRNTNNPEDEEWMVTNVMQTYYIKYHDIDDNSNSLALMSANADDSNLLNVDYRILPKDKTQFSPTGSASNNANSVQQNFGGIGGSNFIKKNTRSWWTAWGTGFFIDSAITANEDYMLSGGSSLKASFEGNPLSGQRYKDIADGSHGIFDPSTVGTAYGIDNPFNISGPGKCISISWSGIYDNEKEIGDENAENANDSFDVGGSKHPGVNETITNLTKIGQRFRFADDPDQQVYTIKYVSRLENRYNYDAKDGPIGGNMFPKAHNKRLTFKIFVENQNGNGIGVDGQQYSPIVSDPNGVYTAASSSNAINIEFIQPWSEDDQVPSTTNPAIWETEPKERTELDIYYEASQAYPISLDFTSNEQFAKYGSVVGNETNPITNSPTVSDWSDLQITLSDPIDVNATSSSGIITGDILTFTTPDGAVTRLEVDATATGITVGTTLNTNTITVKNTPHEQVVTLPYYNCYSFGNGVESNRIRDDFNESFITNGVKVSAVLAERYKEERRMAGMIHSQIFNSTSGVNRLNEFIQALPITKDLNSRHGSIQVMRSRGTDILVITEDRCFNVLSNKDALFAADGNASVVSKMTTLGTATPFQGDFGTTNPESLVLDRFRAYFVDRTRGAVCRLSQNGITPISSMGMHDWFVDNLKVGPVDKSGDGVNDQDRTIPIVVGSYDSKKGLYNVTITHKFTPIKNVAFQSFSNDNYTISYSENAKGWVSFKSYIPEFGLSINKDYYTFKQGELYLHHDNQTRNNFYGTQYTSDFTVILNDQPSSIKSFNTINYEGTQAKVAQNTTADGDGEYYNLTAKTGWYLDTFTTNEQSATYTAKGREFKEKEGKWYNYLRGAETTLAELDQQEFSVQGIGEQSAISGSGETNTFKITLENSDTGSDGSTWDSTPD